MTAYKGKLPYGKMRVDGRQMFAHRLSWIIYKGEIPDGMSVLHKCDVPWCVRPGHLFLGTQAENMRDKCQKGRHRSALGSRVGSSKLSESEVLRIRRLKGRLTQGEIAKQFGVHQSLVSYIHRGKIWNHI